MSGVMEEYDITPILRKCIYRAIVTDHILDDDEVYH